MKTVPNIQEASKKKSSTIFLRIIIVIMGFMALGLGSLILPMVYNGWEQEFPTMAYLRYPILLILGATMVPFFAALYQTLQLINYIDTNKAFSLFSVNALRKIKHSAVAFSGLYIVFQPVVYMVAQADDAPGLVIIGMVMAGAPIVIAVLATVLQRLLQSAIDIKTENDLTV